MEKPLFSIVLIARNEEAVLARGLDALKPFMEAGGEIVLVDTGSTDKTAAIARSYGCVVEEVGDRFVHTVDASTAASVNMSYVAVLEEPVLKEGDKLFNFSAARNYAASLASNEVISFMDADEVFTVLDIEKINQCIRDGFDAFTYQFIFSHDQFGNPGISFTQSKMYNRTKKHWVNWVHEVLADIEGEPSSKMAHLPENIFLLEHFQNQETNRSGYLRGLAYDCFLNPGNDRNCHYFARELFYTGRYRSAIVEFERHIAMDKWPAERGQSFIFMGECYKRLGNEQKAVECYQQAYNVEPGRREPFWALIKHYFALNDHRRVVAYGEAALTIPYSGFYADDKAVYTHLVHEHLYISYWYLGDFAKSREHFYKAWDAVPLHHKYLHDLRFYKKLPKITVILPTLGREDGLERCIRSIDAQIYPKELIQIITMPGDGTVPEKVSKGLAMAEGEYIVYAANDMEFDPACFIHAFLESERDKKALVSFNGGPVGKDEGNINEHFMIRKDFVKEIGGEIFDTRYFHVGVDNLLWAKCKKLNQAQHSENAKFTHYHFSKGGAFDDVYKIGWKEERVKHDRDLLAEDLKKLYTD